MVSAYRIKLRMYEFLLTGGKKMASDKYVAQKKYKAAKMKNIAVTLPRQFVDDFKEACKKLNVSQSSVIRAAMQKILDEAENVTVPDSDKE